MSVELILVTHGNIGEAILATTEETLGGQLPLPVIPIAVTTECDLQSICKKLDSTIYEHLPNCDGILILTDLYGATPCNLVKKYQAVENVMIISGINLSMMMRIMNYPKLSLTDIAEKAISGGHDGICHVCD